MANEEVVDGFAEVGRNSHPVQSVSSIIRYSLVASACTKGVCPGGTDKAEDERGVFSAAHLAAGSAKPMEWD